MTLLVSVFAWVSGLTTFAAMVVLLFILALISSPRGYDGLAKRMCRLLMRCFQVRVRVEGMEKLDRGKSYLFLSNHVNILDGFLLIGYLPWFLRVLELKDHFSWPVYGWFTRRYGNIPLDASGGARTAASLRRADKALRAGTSILILPEGHRTRDGRLGSFGRGAFRVAIQTGAEVVPVMVLGLFRVMRTGSWKITPGTVRLVIGERFKPEDYRGLDAASFRDLARQRMLEMAGG